MPQPRSEANAPATRPHRAATAEVANGDTKGRLLDAAERLFADRGFEGTSMRAVTQAAGTSLSAANYHFGSKEALLQAALRRRLEPLARRRTERLDELEAAADGAPLEVEDIVDAFLRPSFEARHDSQSGVPAYQRIAARLFSDPDELVAALQSDLFRHLSERFLGALSRALPGRSPEELLLGLHMGIGVMVHAVSGHCERGLVDASGKPVFSDEQLLARMVGFVASGLRSDAFAREGAEDSR